MANVEMTQAEIRREFAQSPDGGREDFDAVTVWLRNRKTRATEPETVGEQFSGWSTPGVAL